jgi:hypothetical protein
MVVESRYSDMVRLTQSSLQVGIEDPDRDYVLAADRLAQMCATSHTKPKRVEQHFQRLRHQWERELPAFGRLWAKAEQDGAAGCWSASCAAGRRW